MVLLPDCGAIRGADRQAGQQLRGVGVTVDIASREEGLLVQSVTEGGPADKAGVLAGDVITAVDGRSVAGDARQEGSTWFGGRRALR